MPETRPLNGDIPTPADPVSDALEAIEDRNDVLSHRLWEQED
jgi:hypothetical protein